MTRNYRHFALPLSHFFRHLINCLLISYHSRPLPASLACLDSLECEINAGRYRLAGIISVQTTPDVPVPTRFFTAYPLIKSRLGHSAGKLVNHGGETTSVFLASSLPAWIPTFVIHCCRHSDSPLKMTQHYLNGHLDDFRIRVATYAIPFEGIFSLPQSPL